MFFRGINQWSLPAVGLTGYSSSPSNGFCLTEERRIHHLAVKAEGTGVLFRFRQEPTRPINLLVAGAVSLADCRDLTGVDTDGGGKSQRSGICGLRS